MKEGMGVGFTEAFKVHVVGEVELWRISQTEASRRYGVGDTGRCSGEGAWCPDPKKVWCQTVREIRQAETKGSVGQVCRLFGKSRQAYYQMEKRRDYSGAGDEIFLTYVRAIRVRQPRMGSRKMYWLLKAVIKESDIKMGRDKFQRRSWGIMFIPPWYLKVL